MTKWQDIAIRSLPTTWRIAPFPDYVFFQEGPGLRKWQWANSGMKVVNVTNILADGSVDVTNTSRYVSLSEFEAKYSHFAVEDRDIVIASSGNTYGKVGRINRRHLPLMMNTSVIRLHPQDPRTLHPDFLYVFLRSPLFRDQVERFVTGSAQPNFGPSHLKLMWVPIPPFEIQQLIAAIVAAYDDLIENNTRRIRILEEMAEMIYREWFVNFRFPAHERVKMVESEMGPIPTGWTIEPLWELTSLISRGISPQYDDEAKGLVINQKCIRDGRLSLDPVRNQSKKVPEDKLIRLGDVLINSTGVGTLGRVAQVLEPIPDCTVDSHVSIVRPRNNSEFLGKTLLQLEQHFERLGIGSTGQTELSRERIGSTRLVVPKPDLQELFSRVVAPMNGLIVCCLARNSNLRQTRDLLLPKLISGEVNVKDCESEAVAQGV